MSTYTKKSLLLSLLLSIAIICQFSVDIYLPSLPYLTDLFHTSAALLRISVVIFMFGAGISSFFFGILSDKIGRKKSFVFALGSFLFGSLLCMVAFSISLLILGRLFLGIGTGGCMVLNRVVLCDITENQNQLARFSSYLSMAVSIIPAISPTIGSFIFVHLGWRFNFVVLFITSVFVLLAVIYILFETKISQPQIKNRTNVFQDIQLILSNGIFNGFLVCAGLITTAALVFISISPHLFQGGLGLTPIEYGYTTFAVGVAMICGSYSNSLAIKYFGIEKTMNIGILIILITSFCMLLGFLFGYINIYAILVPVVLYLYGSDFISTNAYAGALSELKEMAGTATAIYFSLQLVFAAIITMLVAYLPDKNQLPIAIILFTIAMIILILRFSLMRKNKF